MAKRTHKANIHGAGVGNGGLADQMAPRQRQDGSTAGGEAVNSTSIFDPVLAELAYRWWCPPGGTILDPFAGGSVRGIVASRLGRAYYGIDLRAEQVEANRDQAEALVLEDDPPPDWTEGDSLKVLAERHFEADMIFTCPPYADLEVYSDDPRDISTMKYKDFFATFTMIMKKAADQLKDNRFLVIVTGDARGKDGAYYGFPADTVVMLRGLGLKLWNEQIIVTPAGSLPARTKLGFTRTRKTGRSHQLMHVFLKGDAKAAVEAIGECDFGKDDPLAMLGEEGSDDPLAGLGSVL